MSLWYPNRPFPPKPHASTHIKGGVDEVLNLTNINNAIGFNVDAHASRHLAGGSDQLFDQNLNTTNTVKFAGVQLGSYVLDTLLANNKVPSAGSADSATQASKLIASGYTLDTLVANNKVPDSDKWDGTHRTDSQTIGGDITIGGDLRVNGNDIKDSGGTVRITLGDPVTVSGAIAASGVISTTYPAGGTVYLTQEPYTGDGAPALRLRGNRDWFLFGWSSFILYDNTAGERRWDVLYGITSSFKQFIWRNSNGMEIMNIDTEGDLWINGSLTQGSLKEFKETIVDIGDTDFLQVLDMLKPKMFNLKDDPDRWRVGFVAEEVPYGLQVYDNEGNLVGIDVVGILTYCVGAIKQLKMIVEELEEKVNRIIGS